VHEALARANFERDVEALTDRMADLQRLILHQRAFPLLDATIAHNKNIRIRLEANDWNDLPPAIAILDPDGSPWTSQLPGGVFNGGPHSVSGKPFICMRGSREYHTHSGHVNDTWDNYRGQEGMNLVGILMQLSSEWRKAPR
jgi:hypothetical protein